MGSLFPRLTCAGMGKTHHAYFRLSRLSNCLAFGTGADDHHCGRYSACSSCRTKRNAITHHRRGRGSAEHLGLKLQSLLGLVLDLDQCGSGINLICWYLRGGTRAAPGSPRNSKAAQMRPFVLVPPILLRCAPCRWRFRFLTFTQCAELRNNNVRFGS